MQLGSTQAAGKSGRGSRRMRDKAKARRRPRALKSCATKQSEQRKATTTNNLLHNIAFLFTLVIGASGPSGFTVPVRDSCRKHHIASNSSSPGNVARLKRNNRMFSHGNAPFKQFLQTLMLAKHCTSTASRQQTGRPPPTASNHRHSRCRREPAHTHCTR